MITGVDHTSFVVSDLDRAIDFYTGLLGFEVDWRIDQDSLPALRTQTGYRDAVVSVAQLRIPNTGHRLELLRYHEPASNREVPERCEVGSAHLCLLVDDLDTAHQDLSRRGVDFVSEPQYFEDGDGIKAVYVLDPDGITIELTEKLTRR